MEWSMSVNDILHEEITKINHTLLPPGCFGDTRNVRAVQDFLTQLIYTIGKNSATAQGLNKVITTAEKLRKFPSHTIYLLKDSSANEGRGAVIGMLRVGRKHLFLYNDVASVREMDPLCVLDFYVSEDRQRHGHGRRLFDYMLKEENVCAEQLAIDGPSPKIEQFLHKYYNIHHLIHQNNNFAVAPGFFSYTNENSMSAIMPAAAGRFSAHHPESAIASVIHGGGGAAAYKYEDPSSRDMSRAGTPDFDAVAGDMPLASEAGAKATLEADAEPEQPTKPSPERPTTLQVEPPAVAVASTPVMTPAGSTITRRDSQLTERGFFDVKFYHNKLW